MKYLPTLFILGIFSLTSYSQEKSIKAIEVGLTPFVIHNNLSFGFSWKENLNEHVVYSKSYIYAIWEYSGYGTSLIYNFNRYLKGKFNEKLYIPFCISTKYEHYYSGESENGPQDWGKLFLGSGFGFKPKIYRFKVRFEFLLGATLFTEYYKNQLRLHKEIPVYPTIKMNTRFVLDFKK